MPQNYKEFLEKIEEEFVVLRLYQACHCEDCIKDIKSFLLSSLKSQIEFIKENMPDTFQNTPPGKRPQLYEDKGWLGWNAYQERILTLFDEMIKEKKYEPKL